MELQYNNKNNNIPTKDKDATMPMPEIQEELHRIAEEKKNNKRKSFLDKLKVNLKPKKVVKKNKGDELSLKLENIDLEEMEINKYYEDKRAKEVCKIMQEDNDER